MTTTNTDGGYLTVRPLGAIGTSAAWFEGFLASRQLRPHPQSALASALAAVRDFRDKALADHLFSFESSDDAVAYYGTAVGADFLTKVVHWGQVAGLEIPPDKLRGLLSGDPLLG